MDQQYLVERRASRHLNLTVSCLEPANLTVSCPEPANLIVSCVEPANLTVSCAEPANLTVSCAEPANLTVSCAEPANLTVSCLKSASGSNNSHQLSAAGFAEDSVLKHGSRQLKAVAVASFQLAA